MAPPAARSGGGTSLRELSSLVPDRRQSRFEPARPGTEREPGALLVLSWNLFHGRDAPPDMAHRTARSLLLRATIHNDSHVQVNRSLFEEFASVLAGADWNVCMVQECPPHWAERLADECQAGVYRALTSRNWLAPLRRRVAQRNPDLMGSWEGGANLILARPPWQVVEGASVLLNPFRERRLRERRRLALVRLVYDSREVCVGNVHLTAGAPDAAAREAHRAAETALEWARGAPLVLGGDFNVRGTHPIFGDLCSLVGLCGAANPHGIDHILSRGLDTVSPPLSWAPERRELDVLAGLERRRLRLSDHAPVEARFSLR